MKRKITNNSDLLKSLFKLQYAEDKFSEVEIPYRTLCNKELTLRQAQEIGHKGYTKIVQKGIPYVIINEMTEPLINFEINDYV